MFKAANVVRASRRAWPGGVGGLPGGAKPRRSLELDLNYLSVADPHDQPVVDGDECLRVGDSLAVRADRHAASLDRAIRFITRFCQSKKDEQLADRHLAIHDVACRDRHYRNLFRVSALRESPGPFRFRLGSRLSPVVEGG